MIPCLIIIVIGVVGLVISISTHAGVLGVMSALCALYAIQALVAEIIGVVVRPTSIFVPRRMTPFPFIIFGRCRIPMNNIERIKSLRKFMGLERADVVGHFGKGKMSVIFSNRDKRLYFFKLVQKFKPSVNIYKGK